MVRVSQQTRLADIASTGAQMFGRLGYRRTRMADVAAATGLSSGAIYTYVQSKEALFHLVLQSLLENGAGSPGADGPGAGPLPLAAPPFAETIALIDGQVRAHASLPALRAAAKRQAPEDARAELAEVIDEHYVMIQRLWPALAVIERCAIDLPELYAYYFQRRRAGFLDLFTSYVVSRIASGHFVGFADASVAAQLAIEVSTWFAWHRLEGVDATVWDDADGAGKRTVIDFISNAFVGPE